jgi:coenzyme Q-binding protein COQ10
VKYIDGPFRYLDNRWRFEPTGPNACKVHFFIDYAFRNRMLGMLMGTMFDRAFRTFAEAFERRADHIHGRRSEKMA